MKQFQLMAALSLAVGLLVSACGQGTYIAGTTTGKVNGVSRGKIDAFLLKLNARGQRVWER